MKRIFIKIILPTLFWVGIICALCYTNKHNKQFTLKEKTNYHEK